jgi:isoleucyl-tRNA synthetase
MTEVRKIVELGLAERDKVNIKVRQILNQALIYGDNLKIDSDNYLTIIAEELNVKKVEVKKQAGDLKVELDTNITPKLKLEGGKRELVRFINLMRKELNLSINDKALVAIKSDSKFVAEVISNFSEDIKKETLISKITLNGEENYLSGKEFKIDGEAITVVIQKE